MLRLENVIPTYILDVNKKEDYSLLKDHMGDSNDQVIFRLYPEGFRIVGKPTELNFDIIDDLFDKKSLFVGYNTIKTFDFNPLTNIISFTVAKKRKKEIDLHKLSFISPQVIQIKEEIKKVVIKKDEKQQQAEIKIQLDHSSDENIIIKNEPSDDHSEDTPKSILRSGKLKTSERKSVSFQDHSQENDNAGANPNGEEEHNKGQDNEKTFTSKGSRGRFNTHTVTILDVSSDDETETDIKSEPLIEPEKPFEDLKEQKKRIRGKYTNKRRFNYRNISKFT